MRARQQHANSCAGISGVHAEGLLDPGRSHADHMAPDRVHLCVTKEADRAEAGAVGDHGEAAELLEEPTHTHVVRQHSALLPCHTEAPCSSVTCRHGMVRRCKETPARSALSMSQGM